MKLFAKIFLITVIAGIGFSIFYLFQRSEYFSNLELPEKRTMQLSSPVFTNNGLIPQRFTCDGEDVNPPLQISQVPTGSKTLVLLVDDPDAPMDVWDHWVVWNIDPQTESIGENSIPTGSAQGMNSSGSRKYMGPCPPSGTHHYHFKLYALDAELNLESSARKSDVETAMKDHMLGWTELIGLYHRN